MNDGMWQHLVRDYKAVKERDPSIPKGIRGLLEVLLCTPGFQAILAHRVIHFLHVRLHLPVLPRFLSLLVRWWTGIEIHPGARIGHGVFIDHGMGVVIGESAIVGDDVVLFQGVTLGSRGNETAFKRHPTLENGVFVGSGARILGPITIGQGSRIGAGSVVLDDIPSRSTVVGPRAQVIREEGIRKSTHEERVEQRITELEREIFLLKQLVSSLVIEKKEVA